MNLRDTQSVQDGLILLPRSNGSFRKALFTRLIFVSLTALQTLMSLMFIPRSGTWWRFPYRSCCVTSFLYSATKLQLYAHDPRATEDIFKGEKNV